MFLLAIAGPADPELGPFRCRSLGADTMGLKTASTGAVRGFPGGGERQRRTERDCSVSEPIIVAGEEIQHWRMSGQRSDNLPSSEIQEGNKGLCLVI